MTARSSRADVRNPLLRLPAAQLVRQLPAEGRAAWRALCVDLANDARQRAAQSWAKNKAPMAAYWKAVSVYARHAARLARDPDHRKD